MHKANLGRSVRRQVSEQAGFLTPVEIQARRLALASEMVDLVLREPDTLSTTAQQALEDMSAALAALVRAARGGR